MSNTYENVKVGSEVELPVEAVDAGGAPVPLLIADCRISIRHVETDDNVVEGEEVVEGSASHRCSYVWTPTLAGLHVVEFFLVDEDGTETYAEDIEITVKRRIAT